MEYYRGDIFYINKGMGLATGSEMESGRPGIIVSNDKANATSPVVEIVYLTTSKKVPLPTHVPVKCKAKSTALCEGIYTVSKERLGDFIRSVSTSEMEKIDKALLISLGISQTAPEEDYALPVEPIAPAADVAKLETERDIYKNLYEQLSNKVVSA